MKKVLITLALIIVVAFIGIQVFSVYNANNIMSNQAVFKVYTSLDKSDIDDYFDLEAGTFNPQEHYLLCKLPVEVQGMKSGNATVNFNAGNIDCNEVYDERRHIKYDDTELRDGVFTLMIVKSGTPAVLVNPEDMLGSRGIIASKQFQLNYSRGKINHILISEDRNSNYCNK